MYELRALLDWSCTATTLSLFDWFKLEDINASLFYVAVTRDGRERRALGERQPRYLKFLQVCAVQALLLSRSCLAACLLVFYQSLRGVRPPPFTDWELFMSPKAAHQGHGNPSAAALAQLACWREAAFRNLSVAMLGFRMLHVTRWA